MSKAIFLDKDRTLIKNIPYNKEVQLIMLEDYVLDALCKFKKAGYLLIVITNQSGIARGYFTKSAIPPIIEKINALLRPAIEKLDGFYYCPHLENGIVKNFQRNVTAENQSQV